MMDTSDAGADNSDVYLLNVMVIARPSDVRAVVDACNRLNIRAATTFNYCYAPGFSFGNDISITCHQLSPDQLTALKREIFKCPGVLQVVVEQE
jgi:hypothetical protein